MILVIASKGAAGVTAPASRPSRAAGGRPFDESTMLDAGEDEAPAVTVTLPVDRPVQAAKEPVGA